MKMIQMVKMVVFSSWKGHWQACQLVLSVDLTAALSSRLFHVSQLHTDWLIDHYNYKVENNRLANLWWLWFNQTPLTFSIYFYKYTIVWEILVTLKSRWIVVRNIPYWSPPPKSGVYRQYHRVCPRPAIVSISLNLLWSNSQQTYFSFYVKNIDASNDLETIKTSTYIFGENSGYSLK